MGQAKMIYGTPGDDKLAGTSGWDTIYAGDGNDQVKGLAGNDVLSGQGGDDTLSGGDGSDYLMGGLGNDVILGGAGANDWASYEDAVGGVWVDLSYATAQDTQGAGVDRLKGIENLYGSAFNDWLFGSYGDNTLSGGAGDDALAGGKGDDVLNGGDGNDNLTGNAGSDRLYGGAGNDYYNVDRGDQVFEDPGAGHDIVHSWVSYHLGANVEDLQLENERHKLDGWGNELDNVIGGNFGANHLYGGQGNDTLNGGAGSDTLDGGSGANAIDGGDGQDTVSYASAASSVFIHLDTGRQESGWSQDSLTSIENAVGSTHDDIIWASGVANLLTGGGGADVFVFSSLAALAGDRITDLGDEDWIDLHNLDSDATQPGVQHGLHVVSAFTHHAGEMVLHYDAASQTTQLLIDVTGDGAADAELDLSGQHTGFGHFQV